MVFYVEAAIYIYIYIFFFFSNFPHHQCTSICRGIFSKSSVELLLNPGSCAQCSVRPSKLKRQVWSRFTAKAKRGVQELSSKDPNSPTVFREEFLKANFERGIHDFLLTGKW